MNNKNHSNTPSVIKLKRIKCSQTKITPGLRGTTAIYGRIERRGNEREKYLCSVPTNLGALPSSLQRIKKKYDKPDYKSLDICSKYFKLKIRFTKK